MRRLSFLVATLESVTLAIYAASLFVTSLQVESTLGSPIVETIIYLIFAALIFLVGRGLQNNQSWARTPYLLMQVFIGIVAYTLFAGTETIYKVSGIAIGLVAIVGIVALFKTPNETN